MSGSQRTLAAAALILVVAGIVLGFVHAATVRYKTLPVLQYRAHVTAAALASENGPEEAIQAAEHKSYAYIRVVDAHTHIIKLATVLLLVALVYPLVSLPEKRKQTLAIVLITGICVFPLGVLAEINMRGRSAQAVAAVGALLVILSFGGIVWGLLRGSAARARL
ncbi:MAG TPA: hypothetical protein VEV41_04315 [Terriglobales bacterium]|jgi:hypothetical protein|nr:hypothetical protein [Terriglobales bacterium]